MLQVLAVERGCSAAIKRALMVEGVELSFVAPEEAAQRWVQGQPELAIFDLRDAVVEQVWAAMRGQLADSAVPVLAIVAPDEVERIASLSFVGDLLVAAGELPHEELRARARRLGRLHMPHKSDGAIQVGGLLIDPAGHQVKVDGRTVELTYQEFLVLSFLAAHRGKVFTRQQLLTRVWGYNDIGGTRTVDIHIRRIRAKLGAAYCDCIQTVRHVGYKFSQEEPG